MRCLDCSFFEIFEDGTNFCGHYDLELTHNTVEETLTGCPFDDKRFENESENEQRARRALEDSKQENIWRAVKRLNGGGSVK